MGAVFIGRGRIMSGRCWSGGASSARGRGATAGRGFAYFVADGAQGEVHIDRGGLPGGGDLLKAGLKDSDPRVAAAAFEAVAASSAALTDADLGAVLRDPKTPGEDFPDGDEPVPVAVYHIDDLTVDPSPVVFTEKRKSDGTTNTTGPR